MRIWLVTMIEWDCGSHLDGSSRQEALERYTVDEWMERLSIDWLKVPDEFEFPIKIRRKRTTEVKNDEVKNQEKKEKEKKKKKN